MSDNVDNRVAILISSGIDSIALLSHYARTTEKIYPLFIQNGFRWEESELYWLKKLLRSLKYNNVEPLTTLSMPLRDTYGSHWSVTGVKAPGAKSKPSEMSLPGRNMFLLAKGSLFCAMNDIRVLAIGTSKTYHFEDGQINFFRQMEQLYQKSYRMDIKIAVPFVEKGREEIMYEAKELGFEYSFSCLTPKGHQHCGECYKCSERKRSFARSGIADKTAYYKRHALPA